MKFSARAQAPNKAKENILILGVYQSAPDKVLESVHTKPFNRQLSSLAASKIFNGASGSKYFLRSSEESSPSLLFVGLGETGSASPEDFRSAGAKIYAALNAEKAATAAVNSDSFSPQKTKKTFSADDFILALAEGIALSDYGFDKYLTKKREAHLKELAFYSEKKASSLEGILERAEATAKCIFIARDLSNEPGNMLPPMELAKRIQKISKENGLSCKVMGLTELKKEKMGALIGVGQGSVNEPCLIVVDYKPKKAKKNAPPIALVGKAITFDSGGISLKPGAQMDEMKHDMSGGANVFAAALLASKLSCPNPIRVVIAAAENMPDGNAIVPSTILHTRAGKTIEVLNTDAEGRLVLADALDFAQDSNPEILINMATLTGAVLVALGNVASGIMGNDEELVKEFLGIASFTEEKHWELPLYKEYAEDMKGKVGDLRNIGSNRDAGSSKGGVFLQAFIRPKVKWMHIDCAGTAWNQRHLAYTQHGATGHGVRTLAEFCLKH
jgi:leucyl aminopeptidase